MFENPPGKEPMIGDSAHAHCPETLAPRVLLVNAVKRLIAKSCQR